MMFGKTTLVKDRFWLWAHEAGSHNKSWGLPKPSRITPVEAAHYLGIRNVIMVRYRGRPELPFNQYAVPLRSLRQVVWSIVGATGQAEQNEREHILELTAREANITGLMMDDFFAGAPESDPNEEAALSLGQLRQLRRELKAKKRRLDLWAVLYDSQLELPIGEYLPFLDKVSLWTWDSSKLRKLKASFEKFEAITPHCGKVLGCYLWDYGNKKPMPLALMQHQCKLGLEWLKSGRIDGMIFLASCICDLELEAVEWTRRWVAKVGAIAS